MGPPPPIPTVVQVPEPLYAYPNSIYGTLPRGPPRPVERPDLAGVFPEDPETEFTESAINFDQLRANMINYATFRQNISAEAAAAALKRAEIAARSARHWSTEDLSNIPQLGLNTSEDSSESSFSEAISTRMASPSPSASRRSRSTSPGKTVTFLEQGERSLNELESSPRRVMHFKPLALAATSLIGGPFLKIKRKAPTPPESQPPSLPDAKDESPYEDDHDIVDDNLENNAENNELVMDDEESDNDINSHEPLGAKLSASLRQTFRLA